METRTHGLPVHPTTRADRPTVIGLFAIVSYLGAIAKAVTSRADAA